MDCGRITCVGLLWTTISLLSRPCNISSMSALISTQMLRAPASLQRAVLALLSTEGMLVGTLQFKWDL